MIITDLKLPLSRKEPEKGKILNIRRVVLALKEKYNFPDICEISEETHNEIFIKNTDGL